MLKKLFVLITILSFFAVPSYASTVAKQNISLLLFNGKVFTADLNFSVAEAVAIDGEKIVAVGTTRDLKANYQAAKEIDLKGKLVTPGFNDAHVHFLNGGMSLLNIPLVEAKTLAEAQAMVAEKLKTVKAGEWITGRGWDHTVWKQNFPTKADLDKIAPNNPVLLTRVDGHVAWANSMALKMAGITKDTKNPEGGEVERDSSGEATGILKETAQGLVGRFVPGTSPEQRIRGLEKALETAAKYGITSVQDNSGYGATKLYREFLNRDKLTVRVTEWQDFENSVEELKRQRAEFDTFKDNPSRIKLGALKGFVDGTLGSKTAAMLEPFHDDLNNSGIPRRSQEELTKMVVERDAAGFQITLHSIGDRANRMALIGFAEAIKSNKDEIGKLRHRIEHAQVVAPSDFKRFAELGIIASMQPAHMLTDSRWADSRLGEYRVLGAYSWHLMRSYNVRVPFGTDFPIESIDPYRTLFAAVARQNEEGKNWQPQERLSMAEAIRCHTYESAYAEFSENEKGEIKAGMLADLIVHSKDLLTIPTSEILKTEILYTIFNGKIIYEKK